MKKICIVSSMYYEDVMKMLLDGANDEIEEHIKHWKKVFKKNIKRDIIYSTGTFEIPYIISKNMKKYDAFIALGCVIKGETPHFDFISQASTNAIMNLSLESKKPIGNGIITCLNMKQAIARKKKGAEAANAIKSVLSQK